ncbi:MAG: hypothetical protein N2Z74_07955 [Syntrophales bacterium]|nr:hypothetical protein [Syntrophales bacterium]
MYRIITLPFDAVKKGFDESPLNDFIINKRVVGSRIEFFHRGDEAYWTVLIAYDEVLEKTPDRHLHGLNEPQRLRDRLVIRLV